MSKQYNEGIDSFMAGTTVSIIPVMGGDDPLGGKVREDSLPKKLPILALRNAVLFPGAMFPVNVGREVSKRLVNEVQKGDGFLAAVPQTDLTEDNPMLLKDFYEYGTMSKVLKVFDLPDGSVSVLLTGVKRVHLESISSTEPYVQGVVSYLSDLEADPDDQELPVILDAIKDRASTIIRSSNFSAKEAISALRGLQGFSLVVNFVATSIEVDNYEEKTKLLSYGSVKERGMALLSLLDQQVEIIKLKTEINDKVRTAMDQQQREYFLNSQLRTIQEELGIDEDGDEAALREEAKKKEWSEAVAKEFEKGLDRLSKYNRTTPEYSIQYHFLQFMLELPWEHASEDNLDLLNAQKVLDEDHFGLESVKERIIEYLAVLKLKGNMKSPILCLYGPPGVGKTSLGKSIARALGRKYQRISLGGLHDEAEIRGHRKTYVGALPGRILASIAKAGTANPVIVLDEVDKIGSDHRGDPASALLEVLDPEQNTTFHDNYLDMDYDLSKVLFITTANTTSTIQSALLDRMELLNVTGYLAEEKEQIAKQFLLPKQMKEHGLPDGSLKVSTPAVRAIIDEYTHESGVRGLEKQLAKMARVTAKKIALGEKLPSTIKPSHLKEYLGLPTAFHDKVEDKSLTGVVTGLAWTAMGGEILFVECSVSNGKGALTMTGNLGDVMKESSTIAYQYIKAHPEVACLTSEELASKDLHIHVPEGAVPKDGPSAGITMVSAMVSALRGESPRGRVAMTGEMTLRGRVLPVGGVKEKILAAKRAGVNTIILSEDNRKDIEDVKEIYRQGLTFVYVNQIDEVLRYVFPGEEKKSGKVE